MTDLPAAEKAENVAILEKEVERELATLDEMTNRYLLTAEPLDWRPPVQRLKRLLGLYAVARLDVEEHVEKAWREAFGEGE